MALPTAPILDFTIPDLHNLELLGLADSSFYPANFNIVNPSLEITPPGFNKVVVIYTTGQLNIFNSNDLGIGCVPNQGTCNLPLPDGFWTIKMEVLPFEENNVTKSFMRTAAIRRTFGVACMKTDIMCCGADIKKQQLAYLDEISYYIECATAAGNDCNPEVAMDLYREANKMLGNFIDNKPNYSQNPDYYLFG